MAVGTILVIIVLSSIAGFLGSPRAAWGQFRASITTEDGQSGSAPLPGSKAPKAPRVAPKEIALREGLLLPPVGRYGRNPVPIDPLAAQLFTGKWTPPKAGDAVTLPDGSIRKWEAVKAAGDGSFQHDSLRGGYVYFAVPSEERRAMVLEASGHSMVFVHGEPRAGDQYSKGYVHLPVLLPSGTNHFLFHCGRGRLQAKLVAPKADAQLDLSDTTLPDLVVGEEVNAEAAVVVLNTTSSPLTDLTIQATGPEQSSVATVVPSIPPLSIRKVGFHLPGPAPKSEGKREVELKLMRRPSGKGEQAQTLDTAKISLSVCPPERTHKRTFRSNIDGSVQYYAIVPTKKDPAVSSVGLVLTLHGADVEAIGQAVCYAPKPWAHVVAPTNRRPFGFDWEDWGRLDALEVLELVQREWHTDPRRTFLTGHSMGGHGTWHLGVTYPDRFAAIGPSAGWVSFWSYAGSRRPENPDPLQELLERCTGPSNTLALAKNYARYGVYILHGDKDDNVPVEQARVMRKQLADFHPDFAYHERPGAGHWWDGCVDWKPMFEFFDRHTIPRREEIRQVDFLTASPGVSAWCHWAAIEAQTKQGKLSSVSIGYDPDKRRFTGSTENVARLALDLGHLKAGENINIELDGSKIEAIAWPAADKRLWLERKGANWLAVPAPSPTHKNPQRYGPFKDAFRNRMQFVYGTRGTPEENAWTLAKARYDAEVFWYQGNGSVDVLADAAFDPAAERDRNVILYGNADNNGAWKALLADSPVQVRRGVVEIGDREETGDDLACLFLRPRPGNDRAVVGVVAGSGVVGMRLTSRLPCFFSGIEYPDCLLLGVDALTRGSAGIRAAGFFGLDWSVASGEFVWR